METPPTQNWKEDFQAMREQEPPDSWDMELPDGTASPPTAVHKPWRGAATFIPKVPVTAKIQSADGKQVRCNFDLFGFLMCSRTSFPLVVNIQLTEVVVWRVKVQTLPTLVSSVNYDIPSREKREKPKESKTPRRWVQYKVSSLYIHHEHFWTICKLSCCDSSQAHHMEIPVEVFNSPSTLPKDPILRKQYLEDLMTKIHGSFSFMQVEFSCLQPRPLVLGDEWKSLQKMCKILTSVWLCHRLSLKILKMIVSLFQDSLLDGESSPTNSHPRLKRRPSGSPSPLGNLEQFNQPGNNVGLKAVLWCFLTTSCATKQINSIQNTICPRGAIF